MSETLIVRGKLPDFNSLLNDVKRHWKFYAKSKKYWTGVTVAECVAQRLRPVTPPCGDWTSSGTTTAVKTPDNIRIASKMIIDGLVKASILPEDNQKIIKGFTDTFSQRQRRSACRGHDTLDQGGRLMSITKRYSSYIEEQKDNTTTKTQPP